MKPVKKTYPSSNYPYYFLNKIVIPADNKKELILNSNDDFIIDLLLFSVSPSINFNSKNK